MCHVAGQNTALGGAGRGRAREVVKKQLRNFDDKQIRDADCDSRMDKHPEYAGMAERLWHQTMHSPLS